MKYGFEKERIPIGEEVFCQFLIGSALERQLLRLVSKERLDPNFIKGAELGISMGRYAWEPATVLFVNEQIEFPVLQKLINAHKDIAVIVAAETFVGVTGFEKPVVAMPVGDLMGELRIICQEQMGRIIPAFYSHEEIATLLETYSGR